MRYLLLSLLLVSLLAPATYAGVFSNLMNAIHKSVEDYNRDYLATGDAVTASLKEGKLNAAFTAYEQNMMVTCDNALANTKAIYKALMDIVNWLPNKIKELWEKFVAGLASIRETFSSGGRPQSPKGSLTNPLGHQEEQPTKASLMNAFDFSLITETSTGGTISSHNNSGSSNLLGNTSFFMGQTAAAKPQVGKGLGDDFLRKFQSAPDMSTKLSTFVKYQGHVTMWQSWLATLSSKEQRALVSKFDTVRAERDDVENLMFDHIVKSLDRDGAGLSALAKALGTVDSKDAKLLYKRLVDKVDRHLKMVTIHKQTSRQTAEQIRDFQRAKEDAGL